MDNFWNMVDIFPLENCFTIELIYRRQLLGVKRTDEVHTKFLK